MSREPNIPKVIELLQFNKTDFKTIYFFYKTYVQDLAANEAESIYKILVKEGGHVYVCGDVTMAEHVYQTLR